jgi:hypothetical protein
MAQEPLDMGKWRGEAAITDQVQPNTAARSAVHCACMRMQP